MSKKKRIFIAIQYLEIGGAERSLIGLLNAIDYDYFDVDLFVYRHTGEFMKLIPPQVNLLPENKRYAAISKPMKEIVRKGHIDIAIGRLLARHKENLFVKRSGLKESIAEFQYVADYTTPLLPSLSKYGEYDLAISFLIPHNIVRDKVRAKQKWAWIHTDYSFVSMDVDDEFPVWDAYDKIITISYDVARGFMSKFPELQDKLMNMENILSEDFVRSQAMEGYDDVVKEINALKPSDKTITLCSVGRYSYPKAFDRAAEICKSILDRGVDVIWYIVGYGGDEPKIRSKIKETGMENRFVLLGKKENPYPYMKACDLYVQPSRYEGKSVTVREAQILGRPVVITAYATASSQLKDGVDGLIVPNEVEGAAEGIVDLLKDKERLNAITANIASSHYGNEKEAEKLKAGC